MKGKEQMQEYTVENERGEAVDTASDRPHARLAAILLREMQGGAFYVYNPDGSFDSRHGEEEEREASRIAGSIGQVERNMRAGSKYER